jgi:hypothetical protein
MKLSLRRLRRRYGRARGHLPISQLSLSDYDYEVGHELRHGVRAVNSVAESALVLNGWRAGRKPIVVALAIEKLRRGR